MPVEFTPCSDCGSDKWEKLMVRIAGDHKRVIYTRNCVNCGHKQTYLERYSDIRDREIFTKQGTESIPLEKFKYLKYALEQQPGYRRA